MIQFLIPAAFLFPVLVMSLLGLTLLCSDLKKRDLFLIVSARSFSALYFLLCSFLFYYSLNNEAQSYSFAAWPYPTAIVYYLDGLSGFFIFILGLSSLMSHFFRLFEGLSKSVYLWILFWGMHAGVASAFLTGDFFNLFVAFEIFLILSYALMINLSHSVRAKQLYLLLNIIVSSILLINCAFVYGSFGTLNMAELAYKLQMTDVQNPIFIFVFALFVFVALAKAAVFPFFQWMPESYATLPAPVAAFFSALLTKVGVYVLLRLGLSVFPSLTSSLSPMLLVLGGCSILVGVLAALGQKHLRKLLAFHTVSQIGYILVGVAVLYSLKDPTMQALALAATLLFTIHHSLVKSSLFASTSVLDHCAGTSDITQSSGYLKEIPWFAFAFLASAFSLAGLPPSSGFWAKFALLKVIVTTQPIFWTVLLVFAGLLTLSSMLKVWIYCITGPVKNVSSKKWGIRPLILPVIVFAFSSWCLALFVVPLKSKIDEVSLRVVNPTVYWKTVQKQGRVERNKEGGKL